MPQPKKVKGVIVRVMPVDIGKKYKNGKPKIHWKVIVTDKNFSPLSPNKKGQKKGNKK